MSEGVKKLAKFINGKYFIYIYKNYGARVYLYVVCFHFMQFLHMSVHNKNKYDLLEWFNKGFYG